MSNELTLQGICASLGKAHGPSNGWYKYEYCPLCKDESSKSPGFAVESKTGRFKCHRCGKAGSVTELLVEGKLDLIPNSENTTEELQYEKLDNEFYRFNVVDEESLTIRYLRNRGIELSTIEMLDVPIREGAGDSNRIAVYPFMNKEGDVVAFQSTFLNLDNLDYDDKIRRYKGKKSFGVGILRQRKKMIVCEGLETGLSVLQKLGNDFGLIVCGDANEIKNLAGQNSWALKGVRKILIAADNDKNNTGINSARALAYAFPTKSSLYMPSLPGTDWNDVLLSGSFEEEWL